MAIRSIQERYMWVKLMYSCLYEASVNGRTCFDPLFFHFNDTPTESIEHTYIVADAIKVSPILWTTEKFKN